MQERNLHPSVRCSTHDRSVLRELSPREQQLVDMVSQAKINKEIAYELRLAEGTVRDYLSRLFRKVGVKNRTELAVWAMNHRGTAA